MCRCHAFKAVNFITLVGGIGFRFSIDFGNFYSNLSQKSCDGFDILYQDVLAFVNCEAPI